MKLRNIATSALLLPLLLTGCFEVDSNKGSYTWEATAPTPAPAPAQKLTEITMDVTKLSDSHLDDRIEYLFVSSFNQYRVAFTVPAEMATNLQITRWHYNTNSYEETQFETDSLGVSGSWTHEWLDVGGYSLEPQRYLYELTYGNGQKKSFDITLKVDLKINGIVHASELRTRNLNLDLDSVYIARDSALITDGQTLNLTAKTVLTRGGIYTDVGLTEFGAQSETTGGSIKLNIEKLYGSIDVKVGKKSYLSNRLQVNIKEMGRWRDPESCGISTSMISNYSEPRISIERNLCTGQ